MYIVYIDTCRYGIQEQKEVSVRPISNTAMDSTYYLGSKRWHDSFQARPPVKVQIFSSFSNSLNLCSSFFIITITIIVICINIASKSTWTEAVNSRHLNTSRVLLHQGDQTQATSHDCLGAICVSEHLHSRRDTNKGEALPTGQRITRQGFLLVNTQTKWKRHISAATLAVYRTLLSTHADHCQAGWTVFLTTA